MRGKYSVCELCVKLNEALPLIVSQDVNQVPVVEKGHLIGVLSSEDIMHVLESRRGLGLDERANVNLSSEQEKLSS